MGAPLSPADSTLQFWGNAGVWPDRKALEEQSAQMQAALDAGFPILYSNASEWCRDCAANPNLDPNPSPNPSPSPSPSPNPDPHPNPD